MQGGPSLNSDGGLFNSSFSNSSGVNLFIAKKNCDIVIASPLKLKAYLVVFVELKYGKFKKFPVSSSDFNSTCFGKTSAFPNPKNALIAVSLSRKSLASTGEVVNKKICAPPLLDRHKVRGS